MPACLLKGISNWVLMGGLSFARRSENEVMRGAGSTGVYGAPLGSMLGLEKAESWPLNSWVGKL